MTQLYKLTRAQIGERIAAIIRYGTRADIPELDSLLLERKIRFGVPKDEKPVQWVPTGKGENWPEGAQWAVLPDLRPWRGDTRRNNAPYVLTDSPFIDGYNLARYAAHQLRKRGIACYVEMIGT